MKNLFIGNNELRIVEHHGFCYVIEEWENWATVFSGNYTECEKYLEERYIEHLQSITG